MNGLEIKRFIGRIRNTHKRAYAEAYWDFLRKDGPDPDVDQFFACSAMAKQGVRMEIDKLFGIA